jgi:hypothetical protein
VFQLSFLTWLRWIVCIFLSYEEAFPGGNLAIFV